jgi:hypothetical protein
LQRAVEPAPTGEDKAREDDSCAAILRGIVNAVAGLLAGLLGWFPLHLPFVLSTHKAA